MSSSTFSATAPFQADRRPETRKPGFKSLLAFLATRAQRARTQRHLNALDDRLLADMGMMRTDIPALFR